jgi:hypoxanthine phosphoribosyltransferase
MASIQLKDRFFDVFLSEEEIQERIVKLANQLNEEYAGESILFISVLNGAFMFTSDLMRSISLDCEVQFVRYKSYEGTSSTGEVKELLGVPEEVEGRHVVVVEDIVETGNTIEYLSKKLNLKNPASVKFCALLFKPEQYHKSIEINYTAFDIGSEFVVGYGLDYDGAGRNLRDIYKETNQK